MVAPTVTAAEAVSYADGMPKMIFVNLPVSDVQRATAFYTGLGFEMNPQFSNENASCIVISDTIFVMLLVKEFFATFTARPVADATAQIGSILALSTDSREEVDELMAKVLANGGLEPEEARDLGFMYSRMFEDPDGHTWEPMWMDPSAVEG